VSAPNFVEGAVIGVLGNQLGGMIASYNKSREDLQSARIETEKNCGKIV
jgi:hypothetical protein